MQQTIWGGVFTGFYDVTSVLTFSNVESGTPIVITFHDLDDTGCTYTLTVNAPDCDEDPECVSSCTALPTVCDDNGTPFDGSDDTYTTQVMVVGQNTGSCFTYTINGQSFTQAYGAWFTVGPFPISGGNVIFEVVDCDNTDCSHNMLIVAPAEPCSNGTLAVGCPVSNHFCPIIEQDIMLYQTDPFDCSATVVVTTPDVTGACGDGSYTVSVDLVNMFGNVIATIDAGQPMVFNGVVPGDYFIRYRVTDTCGNTVTQDCRIRVADIGEPVAVCNGLLNVQLGGWGLARLYTTSINNGSYDNCGIASIEVRRIYNRDPQTCDELANPTYSNWGPYVEFNCCDAGTYVTVEMRVTDIYGNYNVCWSEVLVEDKTLPYCVGLVDQTVECNELPGDFDPTNLSQLATYFGTPDVFDNCSAEAVEYAPVITNENGNIVIVRNFVAIDAVGNESATTFQQVITIVGCETGGGGNAGGGDETTPTIPQTRVNPNDLNPNGVSQNLVLYQNFPNPAVDETTIHFFMAQEGRAVIEIYDALGKRVFIQPGEYPQGENEVRVNTSRYNGGVYQYQVTANGETQRNKMLIVRD
ncbi:MAG: T9SS type A sorting domain-containing protein [Saprospiraceae bacterium]